MSSEIPEAALRLAETLSKPRWKGRYPSPDFEGRSLPNVGASAFLRAGGSSTPPLLSALHPDYSEGSEPRGPGTTSVVFLLDGFGWSAFRSLVERARSASERHLAEALVARTLPLTTVFPSTTSSALISLSNGTAPGTHGIVGYTEYFPAWGSILNTLKFAPPWGGPRDVAIAKGFQPRDLLTVPTLFSRGIRSVALTKEAFQGSAFTRILYEGAKFEGYLSLSDLSHHLARILSLPRSHRPGLVWVYWDLLDAVGHLNGPHPEMAMDEIAHVFRAFVSAAARMTPQAREGVHLFATGDHGQVEVSPPKARAAHEDARLMSLLQRPPSCERRAAILQARAGQREALEEHLRATLPEDWTVLSVPECIAGGLFGPPPHHPDLSARLGDFLVLAGEGGTMWYRPPGARGPEDRFLRGSHGGLSPNELLVALVSTPFEELARWQA
ncbi:MAG: alkaline phosphatase family protein [Euryarchaeota archaeon]|nr:alkaline phosphatase family protein [Euryarchaeota archaeon]MDE1835428.1 alkaline phosphatase family protein [Euryarchaeota archaeon]MDE1879564.1 alkaline phosphatase family protein [Euryarchaeota archaeon]MDE2046079.1 alkaline phosphatase family protein [Thermoplasmata archaeon]